MQLSMMAKEEYLDWRSKEESSNISLQWKEESLRSFWTANQSVLHEWILEDALNRSWLATKPINSIWIGKWSLFHGSFMTFQCAVIQEGLFVIVISIQELRVNGSLVAELIKASKPQINNNIGNSSSLWAGIRTTSNGIVGIKISPYKKLLNCLKKRFHSSWVKLIFGALEWNNYKNFVMKFYGDSA